MKYKVCHDVSMHLKHSGQGVGPLFSKKIHVVPPSGCEGHKDILMGLQVDRKFL